MNKFRFLINVELDLDKYSFWEEIVLILNIIAQ